MAALKAVAAESLGGSLDGRARDLTQVRGKLKDDLAKAIYQRTRRRPMVLPVIMSV
jgi:mRNA degradation ribonuclease J1/J2